MGFATPEEAARGDIPPEYVRVIAVIVRGDMGVVAQITNADCFPDAYEVDTAYVSRNEDRWSSGMSSNGTQAFIPTSDSRGTLVAWQEAPADVTAARFALGDDERTVVAADGFVVAVFDDVPLSRDYDGAWITGWLSEDGWQSISRPVQRPWLARRVE
jgi:hypothetical protein